MDKLERIAGRMARAVGQIEGSPEEMLSSAGLFAELAGELELCRARDDVSPEVQREESGSAERVRTILVVEPDADERDDICRIVQELGHSVIEAADAGEALEICRLHGGGIDTLLTELLLPELSGRELAELAALLRPNLDVIYFSAHAASELTAYGLLAPSAVSLAKPLSAADLAAALVQPEPACPEGPVRS